MFLYIVQHRCIFADWGYVSWLDKFYDFYILWKGHTLLALWYSEQNILQNYISPIPRCLMWGDSCLNIFSPLFFLSGLHLEFFPRLVRQWQVHLQVRFRAWPNEKKNKKSSLFIFATVRKYSLFVVFFFPHYNSFWNVICLSCHFKMMWRITQFCSISLRVGRILHIDVRHPGLHGEPYPPLHRAWIRESLREFPMGDGGHQASNVLRLNGQWERAYCTDRKDTQL